MRASFRGISSVVRNLVAITVPLQVQVHKVFVHIHRCPEHQGGLQLNGSSPKLLKSLGREKGRLEGVYGGLYSGAGESLTIPIYLAR